MVKNGYFSLGKIAGVPVLIHVAAPLGAWIMTGFHFVPVVWVGFFFIILMHELGHAWMVKKVGCYVRQVEILPMGGTCSWVGHATPFQEACIAFAGIWMQAVLFILAKLFLFFFADSLSSEVRQFMRVLVTTNVWLMALNLLPVEPMDGYKAWRFFPLGYKKIKLWRTKKQIRKLKVVDFLDS